MSGEGEVIRVLIVDDIPDTRENLRKLLAFETDIEVVGGEGAGTGREAIELATLLRPDVVLMDINMPDMDGIAATKAISTAVRSAAVVIMSVQSEPGYLRQAMLAGARDFLTKPIASEELYSTIRRVYERVKPIKEQEKALAAAIHTQVVPESKPSSALQATGTGHVIVVYSPQAGAGVTTLATNIASALMRPDTRVLLIDCNLQFGDVDAFLNLQAQSNISDLTKAVHDLDREIVDNVLVTHPSGLKVLVAPSHPEHAYDVQASDVRELIDALAVTFDFVVIDTPTQYDQLTVQLFDVAERIVLVANPTIPSVRNVRKMLDIFDSTTDIPGVMRKVLFVLNRVAPDKERGMGTVPTPSIENHLKRQVIAAIPQDDRAVLTSVNQGVPLVAKMKSRSPGREMVALAEHIRREVQSAEQTSRQDKDQSDLRSKSGIRTLFNS